MADQILVVGLGTFGMSLSKALSEKGAEVLAVDINKELVEEASEFVTEAIVADAMDESEMSRLKPDRRDASVCAIGSDSKEASIICTVLLRQMGSPLVIARATDKLHKRILQMVGAHQIITPEEEFGKRFANRLLFRHVIADTSIGEDLQLTEICVQPSMAGKNLVELQLPKKFGIIVAGIRKGGPNGRVLPPRPNDMLQPDDNLILVSSEQSISQLVERVQK